MIRLARSIPFLILCALCTACVDFVAVEENDAAGMVIISSTQEADLIADVEVSHSGMRVPPRVTVGEASLAAEGGRPGWWIHSASVAVDSLTPELDLAVESDLGLHHVIILLLRRTGDARYLDDGDLLLPVVYGRDFSVFGLPRWTVELMAANGDQVLEITGRSALPRPLVIDGSMLPAGVTEARVEIQLPQTLRPMPYPLAIQVRSSVNVVVPPQETDSGPKP